MNSQATSKKCTLLLKKWKENLDLTNFEKAHLSGEIKELEKQISRLSKRHIRVTVFGRVGVGKSSLLNALIGENFFATNIAHGCTRKTKGVIWEQPTKSIKTIELIDTPGIDEIKAKSQSRLSSRIALHSDLILLVLNSDITRTELGALKSLLKSGKPILLVLNKCDQWKVAEIKEIIKSIRNKLPSCSKQLIIKVTAADPHSPKICPDGRVRSKKSEPKVKSLQEELLNLIEIHGNTILALNAIKQADSFYHSLKSGRLKRRKLEAQGLIGKFATLKASGIAINPLLIFDLATGLAFDTALVIQLSKLYGLELRGRSARKLLKELSINNSLLCGVHFGIQFTLGTIKHLFFLMSPLTGGLSLVSTAPIALAQAAIAVHTTKLTGRLAAQELLLNSYQKGSNPKSILLRLSKTNPNVQLCLKTLGMYSQEKNQSMNPLLP